MVVCEGEGCYCAVGARVGVILNCQCCVRDIVFICWISFFLFIEATDFSYKGHLFRVW